MEILSRRGRMKVESVKKRAVEAAGKSFIGSLPESVFTVEASY